MGITREQTCLIACCIDSGVSYEGSCTTHMYKKQKRDGPKSLKSYIDEQIHCHREEVVECWTCLLRGRSRIAFAHAADFEVSEITWGETKMWCQLLRESCHCYWILSLIWLAITLHLLLTTSVSTRGSATGLVASTERKTTPCRRCCRCKQSDKHAILMLTSTGPSLCEGHQ